MDTAPEAQRTHGQDGQHDDPTQTFLEALLIDDAKFVWDPVTGLPKILLDSEDESAYHPDKPL